MRKCLATGQSFPKNELLRIVKTPEGEICVDLTGKKNGRGAYISKSVATLEIIKKKNILSRALEAEIPSSVYEEIERVIHE